MKIHEYQARLLFNEYGIPTPDGFVAGSPEEARNAAASLDPVPDPFNWQNDEK